MESESNSDPSEQQTSLRELALLFLRLGATAFGGPAAHIALMENEVVRRRGWLSQNEFLDLLGATSLIPGPSSTEMAVYIGRIRARLLGMIVSGICFIVPAAVMVGILAWTYVRFNRLPQVAGILYGVEPVVIAVVFQALWNLRKAAFKSWFLATIGLCALAACFVGLNIILVLVSSGVIVALMQWFVSWYRYRTTPTTLLSAAPFGLLALFFVFLKIGATLFGTGYVLLAYLRADLVHGYGWLTEKQLLDAVAVGQVTPGPVFTTATFIGYVLGGISGAVVATVGIFLPSFFYVGLTAPLLPKIRRSPIAGAFLDGINVGALALMVFVTWQLTRAAVIDVPTAIIAVISALLLVAVRVNATFLILAGALIGLILKLLIH